MSSKNVFYWLQSSCAVASYDKESQKFFATKQYLGINEDNSGTSIQRRAKGLEKRVRFIKVPLSRVIAKNSIDLLLEI